MNDTFEDLARFLADYDDVIIWEEASSDASMVSPEAYSVSPPLPAIRTRRGAAASPRSGRA